MAERFGSFRAAREIARSELRRLARDRRALFSAVLLPALIYPLFFHGQSWLQSVSRESMDAQTVRVALDLEGASPEVAERLEQRLSQEVPIELVPLEAPHLRELTASLRGLHQELYEGRPSAEKLERTLVARIFAEGFDLLVLAAPHSVLPSRLTLRVHYDGSDELSNEARTRVERGLVEVEIERRADRLRAALGPRDPARGLDLLAVDVASAADAGGAALGRLLPLLAVLVLVAGGSYAALGTFAGEREAGTLETLLVQPVSASAVAWGKFAAVLLVALAALACNVASMLASLALGLGALPGLNPEEGGAAIVAEGGGRLLLGGLVFLPTAVMVCALLALVSARARSFREGQHVLLPLSLCSAVPAAAAGWSDLALDPLLAFVPVFGPCLALRDALRGTLVLGPAAVAWLASAAWAAAALRSLSRTLDAESVLRAPDIEQESGERRLQSRRALQWGMAAVLVVYGVGGWAQSRWPIPGLLFTLWGILPVLALLAVRGTARRSGESIPRALGLVRPSLRHALGAVLLAPAAAQVALGIVTLQQQFAPLPAHALEAAQHWSMLEELSPAALLFVFALSPGVCEELLFRGALLSGLRRDLTPRRAVVLQALLFAAAHMSLHRILPTAIVGVLLGWVTLRSRSLLPAMLLHVAYDALVVLSTQVPWLQDARLAWLAVPGLALLWRHRERAVASGPSAGPVAA